MSVFDARTLHHLIEVTDDPDFVLRLVGTYRGLLGRRVERIETYVAAGDVHAALDAARSLKGGSLMTGAVELAEIATRIEGDLRDGDLETPRTMVALLGPAAVLTLAVLEEFEHNLRLAVPTRSVRPAQVSIDSMR